MPKPTQKVHIKEETRKVLVLELVSGEEPIELNEGPPIEVSGEFMRSYFDIAVDFDATQRALEQIRDRGYA